MLVADRADNTILQLSLAACTFSVKAGKFGDKDIVEAPLKTADDNLHSEKVSLISVDLQK